MLDPMTEAGRTDLARSNRTPSPGAPFMTASSSWVECKTFAPQALVLAFVCSSPKPQQKRMSSHKVRQNLHKPSNTNHIHNENSWHSSFSPPIRIEVGIS